MIFNVGEMVTIRGRNENLTEFKEEVTDLKHFAVQDGRWVSLHY